MKTIQNIKQKSILILLLSVVFLGCEREISDEAVVASFSSTGEIFTDSPVGLGSDFYFPYGGSKATAWTVDETEAYEGSASMRFDVPNADDPNGNFAGAIFRIDGAGRDLTKYDALTFWIKASQGVTIGELGFGEDFILNEYVTTLTNVSVGTAWTKVIIPIPDASKLKQERGMFRYSAGTQGTNGGGFTFWVDELKFEKLGTIAHPRPKIFNGVDESEQTFIGATISISGLFQTFNLPTGADVTVIASPKYFDFSSSDNAVATVSDLGVVSVSGTGNAIISATLNGDTAEGSLTVNSLGQFTPAPTPTEPAANVLSIFSDAYTNEPVDFYNGYYAPFQTTQGQNDITINGDNIIKYSLLNFVGIEFKNPTIDASQMDFLHIDIQVENTINPGDFVAVELADFGADGAFGGGDDSSGRIVFNSFTTGNWVSLDIPLGDFNLTSKLNLGQMLFITEGTNPNATGTITDILVDNIYLYKTTGPTIPFNFDDTNVDYSFTTFNGASFAVVDNPQLSGINATASKVGALTNSGNQWEGCYTDLDSPLNLANGNKVKFKLYSTSAVPVLLKLEGGLNSAAPVEIAVNHTGSGWEELEFTFNSTNQYERFTLFVDGPGNTSGTFYIDDVLQTN